MLTKCDPRAFEQMTEGMPGDAIKLINGLQPYQRADSYRTDALWALNALRNQDAHRFLVGVAPKFVMSSVQGITLTKKQTIDHGDIVASAPLDVYREQNLKPEITYQIGLSEGALAGEDAQGTLNRIYVYVRNVAYPPFEGFFPQRP